MLPALETALPMLLMWGVIGYLLGSIPFGMVITRAFGLGNLREIGSGNIGTTNVLRTGSKAAAAAATLFLDGGKGAAAVLLARALAGEDAAQLGGAVGLCRALLPGLAWVQGRQGCCDFPRALAGYRLAGGHRLLHDMARTGAAATDLVAGGALCGCGGSDLVSGPGLPLDRCALDRPHAGDLLAAQGQHRAAAGGDRAKDWPEITPPSIYTVDFQSPALVGGAFHIALTELFCRSSAGRPCAGAQTN